MTLTRPLLPIDPKSAALVLIDLQRGIVGRPFQPRTGEVIVQTAARFATTFRERGGLIVRVRVSFDVDGGAALRPDVDESAMSGTPPAGWDEFAEDAAPAPGDIVITKRQWGAFYGTDLDLQLRRRKRSTIILGGISTNFGVESTGRDAWERGYQVLFVEDLMASAAVDAHNFAITKIFPRIGRVCQTDDVLQALV